MADRRPQSKPLNIRNANTHYGAGEFSFIDQGEVLRAPDVTRTSAAPRANKGTGNTKTSSGTGGK